VWYEKCVDDDEDIRRLAGAALKQEGFEGDR
jgi:hypothetical protein